ASGGSAPAVGSYTIPTSAATGLHRLRVRMTDITGSNSCTSDGIGGEVEDYLISIMPPPPCSGTPTAGITVSNPAFVCSSGTPFTLSLPNATVATGLTYQWQMST